MLEVDAYDPVKFAREEEWANLAALEKAVVEPYVAFTKLTDAQWLEQLNENAQTIMKTNAQLQDELSKRETIVQELRRELQKKEEEYESIRADLAEGKRQHHDETEKLRILREARLSEEGRMRDHGVVLHTHLATLTQENVRLENQRREEERQIERQRIVLLNLQREAMQLAARKAEFEGNHLLSMLDVEDDHESSYGISRSGSKQGAPAKKRASAAKGRGSSKPTFDDDISESGASQANDGELDLADFKLPLLPPVLSNPSSPTSMTPKAPSISPTATSRPPRRGST